MSDRKRFSVSISSELFKDYVNYSQIVFHGINKSGSLAMSKVLQEAYSFAQRDDEFISHYHIGGTTERYVDFINTSKVKPSLFIGHYLFGALKPSPNRLWITQFRHPLPRIVSCYQWLKNKHEKKVVGAPFVNLKDFVIQSRHGVSHSQVIQLGAGYGQYGKNRQKRLSARDLYEISIDNLESNIFLIGIAERFEESIFSFAGLCGLSTVSPWVRDDRNKGRKLISELTQDEIDLIQDCYEYDFKLYEYALGKFELQINHLEIGGGDFFAYQETCKSEYKDRILLNSRS